MFYAVLRPVLNKRAAPRCGCCLATPTLSNAGTQQHQHLAFLAAAARSNKLDLGSLPTEINVFKPLAVIKKDFIIVIYIYLKEAV